MKVIVCNSIFARYESVREGKKFDPDNQPLNNVEKALNRLGIAMRSDSGTFKNFSDVLTELSGKWKGLNDVQKSEAATAMAGTYQRNKFLTLMENMNQVTELQQIQMKSAGNAMERYGVYAESTEAKLNDLKNAQEQMWMSFLNSSVINSVISGLTNVVKTIQFLGTNSLQSTLQVAALSMVLITLVKNSANVITFIGMLGQVLVGTATMSEVAGASFTGLIGIIGKLKAVLIMLFLTPEGLAFMAIVTAVGLATAGIIKHIQAQKELAEQTQKNTQSYKDLTQAMNENNTAQIKSNMTDLQTQQKKLQDLLSQKKSAEEQAKALAKSGQYIGGSSTGQMSSDLNNLTSYTDKQIADLKKSLTDAGFTIDETTGKIVELQVAESRIATNDTIDQINKEKDAMINHDNEIINLINEYNQLSSVENANATQKARMSQISNQLAEEINGLVVVKDAEGNATVQNTSLLSKEIQMRNADMDVAKTNANVKLQTAKNNAQCQVGETTVTYQEILKRINMYQAEINALNSLKNAQGQTMDDLIAQEKAGTISAANKAILDNMARGSLYTGAMATGQLGQLQAAKAQIDAIFDSGSGGANFGGGGNVSGGSSDYFPSGGSKAAEDAAKKAEELRKKMESDVKDVESAITEIIKKEFEKRKQAIEDEYNKRKDALQKEKDLYNKQNSEDDYNKNLRKEQESLNSLKAQETNARRDTSLAGQSRLRDILKQEKEQQDKIDQMVLEHTRDRNNQVFDENISNLDKEKDAKEKALDEQFSDENISKMVNKSMYTGVIDGLGSVEDAYRNFQNTYNNGLTASGKLMEDELISKWRQVQSLINGTSGISIGVNFGSLPKYKDGGIITHTGMAWVDGTANDPEIAMNGKQAINLLRNMSIQAISTPKLNGVNKQNNVNLNITSPLINIQGNADGGIIKALESKTNDIVDIVYNRFNKELIDQGVFSH